MTAEKLTWREAVETVLRDAADPMHYTDIAEEIATRKLRGDELGATPANTAATIITVSMRDEGSHSPFVRVERGVYALRDRVGPQAASAAVIAESSAGGPEVSSETTGVVSAFGMFWDRAKVAWAVQPKILVSNRRGQTL